MDQMIVRGTDSVRQLDEILKSLGSKRYLLVCGQTFSLSPVNQSLKTISVPNVQFQEFSSNPQYEDVCKGVQVFNNAGCDAIVAIGGGSAIDVAKCIKLYCHVDQSKNYLEQENIDSGIPLIAIPTTAGTGSESTRYAVIYFQGEKQSVTHDSIMPNFAILNHTFLYTLPVYQKKCTLLDALCQGLESWWSVNSNDESKSYANLAVKMVMQNTNAYIFDNASEASQSMLLASNYAGRAINITQTTAAHAMSYKLTSLYQLPHGHAVAICLPQVWRHMQDNLERCIDPRGSQYLRGVFEDIAAAMDAATVVDAIKKFEGLLAHLDILPPVTDKNSDLDILAQSVNPVRLKNTPICFTKDELYKLYSEIVHVK